MKNHLVTLILLLLAVIAFGLKFFVSDSFAIAFDITAFVLAIFAAIAEIVLSERGMKKIKNEIDNIAVWETLSSENYKKLEQEGKIDENKFYATYED